MSKRKKHFISLIGEKNPLSFQMLGICSALAVTSKLATALTMAISMCFVLILSSLTVSSIRKLIPRELRIITFLLIISTLVVATDIFLKAYFFEVSKELSIFISLIVTNCIVMGRAESFALHNKPIDSAVDAFGSSIGYGMFLVTTASIREAFGQGALLGFSVIPDIFYRYGYQDILFFRLAPSAFIILGVSIALQKKIADYIYQLRNKDE